MTPRFHGPAFAHLSDFGRPGGPEIDHEAQLKSAYDDGYQQGVADGRAEAQADGELRMTEASFLFETQRKEDRETWQRECAEALSSSLDNALASVVRHVEDHVASLLKPWLVEQLRVRAIEELEKAVTRALSSGVKISIEAPADILARLEARLAAGAFEIEYSEAETSDIRAHVGDTEITSNIAGWIADLEAATA